MSYRFYVFPPYLYHKQIHLGIQKHHESTQHIQRIQDLDLIHPKKPWKSIWPIPNHESNHIKTKSKPHIPHNPYIHIFIYYIYMYTVLNTDIIHLFRMCKFVLGSNKRMKHPTYIYRIWDLFHFLKSHVVKTIKNIYFVEVSMWLQ